MIRPPGTVRVGGGVGVHDTRIEVSDGLRWLPIRCVTRVDWTADCQDATPRLTLVLEPLALGHFTYECPADRLALRLAGVTEEQFEAARIAVAERLAAHRLIDIWGWMVRSLATWGRRSD
jgi:hypothetical protein